MALGFRANTYLGVCCILAIDMVTLLGLTLNPLTSDLGIRKPKHGVWHLARPELSDHDCMHTAGNNPSSTAGKNISTKNMHLLLGGQGDT